MIYQHQPEHPFLTNKSKNFPPLGTEFNSKLHETMNLSFQLAPLFTQCLGCLSVVYAPTQEWKKKRMLSEAISLAWEEHHAECSLFSFHF